MPLVISEDKTLNKKRFHLGAPLKKHLRDTLGKYNEYSSEKGYKRLNALLFPEYNKRSEGDDGESISFGDAKKIQADMKKMNRRSLEYALNGGDKMKRAVDGFMSTVRNINKEIQPVKPVKPNAKQLKPQGAKDNSLEVNKDGLSIHEHKMRITESQLLRLKKRFKYL